jgi:hypothetical protein
MELMFGETVENILVSGNKTKWMVKDALFG